MKIGMLGTGQVGSLLGARLIETGHTVMIGGREPDNEKGLAFVKNNPTETAFYGTFAEASNFGDIIFNATNGKFALEALKLANTDFAGKIIIDVSNPLDISTKPPMLLPEFANTNSLGETIQRAYPKAAVVKTLNSVAMTISVNPVQLNNGDHSMFVAGNDEAAKAKVKALLVAFGWKVDNLVDLGGIIAARGMESYLTLWNAVVSSFGGPMVSLKIIKPSV